MDTTYTPDSLSLKECEQLGVTFPSVRMNNGEYRFRCSDKNGYGYALTKMPTSSSGGWQNSHYHKSVIETYVVQSGWIGFATLTQSNNTMELAIYRTGEVVTTKINQAHNVFLSTGSIIHTVKHGDCSTPNDWFTSPELDSLSKPLSQKDIVELAKS